MDQLIDNIKGALSADATTEQKAAAAAACRTLLAAFEAEPGMPIAASPAIAAAPAPPSVSPIALLSRLSPDQALDLLIAKLRAAVPDQPKPQPPRGFKVQLVHVPRDGRSR